MHDNDFRIVKSKNSRSKSKRYLITTKEAVGGLTEEIDPRLKERLSEIESKITCEEFYPDLVDVLRQRSINRVICLGLGHFSTCSIARVQLALLLAIRKSLPNIQEKIFLQDPVFTRPEIDFLRSLTLAVLEDNLEGRFATEEDQRVLYFLPHCPKSLTNNLLATNWTVHQLESSVIVCNSFQALLTNTLEREIAVEASFVKKIAEFTTEKELRVPEKYFDSFNDTSIHFFADLKRITDPAFWVIDKHKEIAREDPELITKTLEKSLRIN